MRAKEEVSVVIRLKKRCRTIHYSKDEYQRAATFTPKPQGKSILETSVGASAVFLSLID